LTKGSKRRGKKPAAGPALSRKAGPSRPGVRSGRSTRRIGQFRNLGFVAALVVAVVAAIALIGVANLLGGDDGNTTSNNPIDIPDHTAVANGTTLGNADAPVTIYEYSDFQCPYCRVAAAEIVPALDKDYLATGKAKLIFKIMAFIGQESRWAAEAALCAGDQGKFWEYHNKLYEEQDGENKGTFKVENLKRFAGEIGLDQDEFNTCFDAGKYTAQIADAMDEARNRGVNSTPTFFVGQTQVDSTYDAISTAIDDELVKLGLATPQPTATPTPEATPTVEGTPTAEGTSGG
jgi:protein-disulfide isomerase